MRPRNEQAWPKKVVRGGLIFSGIEVDENSTPWTFNRHFHDTTREFTPKDSAGKVWRKELEEYAVTTEFKLDGTIDSLVIEAVP